MKNRIHTIILLGTFLLIFISDAFSQKIVKVSGSAEVRIEMNMTEEQTREKALQQAMIKAIENEFGTYVEQTADLIVQDGSHSFTIIGSTKVRGEWVETTGKPEFNESTKQIQGKNGKEIENWITCGVKGKAKKSTPKAMLEIQTLNCPQIECRAEDFISGEALYLHFKSPVKGYLSIFLSDDEIVNRLLPYNNMKEKYITAVDVEPDKEYIFFCKRYNYFENEKVDEFELHTSKDKEVNTLYIVFAQEKYVKPILISSKENKSYKDRYIIPKTLSVHDFNRWLAENKSASESFQDKKLTILIYSKN